MFTLPINLLILICALGSIVGDRENNRTGHYIFKPLTMLLLIGCLLWQGIGELTFSYAIFIGLLFSLMGDIFLMLPKERFIAGLLSFLVAHIAYIFAFFQVFEPQVTFWWLGVLLAFAVVFYGLLSNNLGGLKVPVIVYISVIITMIWIAGELYLQSPSDLNMIIAVGAIVFACSDSALAWNKFKKPFKGAQWVILSTYFFAQWMFAQAVTG